MPGGSDMERDPEPPQQGTDDHGEEPPPYAPDPRLMDVMERGADVDPADVWARLEKTERT